MGTDEDPIVIAKKGLEKAKAEGFTTVIVDTAGRQVIDEPLMKEIKGACVASWVEVDVRIDWIAGSVGRADRTPNTINQHPSNFSTPTVVQASRPPSSRTRCCWWWTP